MPMMVGVPLCLHPFAPRNAPAQQSRRASSWKPKQRREPRGAFTCMLRLLSAQLGPPRVLATFPRLLTALDRAHARPATSRTPLALSRGRLTVCASATAPEVAELPHDEAMSHQQGSRGGRGPRAPMRGPAASGGPPLQQHGAANGPGGHGGEARAAAGNRTSSTTKAHLTNVRFDALDVSDNTKRRAVMACGKDV